MPRCAVGRTSACPGVHGSSESNALVEVVENWKTNELTLR